MKILYKHKTALLCVIFTINISSSIANIPLVDSDGDGSINISTIEELRYIAQDSTLWNLNIELDNDIDASATKFWDNGNGFLPIGTYDRSFRGCFYGNNHTISNLYINRPQLRGCGLFGALRNDTSIITDLTLQNCVIIGKYNVGGIVGHTAGYNISNVYVEGYIRGVAVVGGITGSSYGANIERSQFAGNIVSKTTVGGIVGKSYRAAIQNCHSNTRISCDNMAGSMVGHCRHSQVIDCSGKGDINGKENIGGLIGFSDQSELIKCYASCFITANIYSGGLVGDCYKSTVYNCYSQGKVAGDTLVGGFCGENHKSDIRYCYSTTSVLEGTQDYGGFVGYWYFRSCDMESCIWSKELAFTNHSVGGKNVTTAQMKTKSTYTDAGWDFENVWAIDPKKNVGFPYLQAVEK